MEEEAAQPSQTSIGPFTVLISALLTLWGIVGIAIGVAEFGFQPAEWSTNTLRAAPILVSAVLDLLAGTALGVRHYLRAFHLLVLAQACRVLWSLLAQWGWLDTGHGTLEFVGLLLAWWLVRSIGATPNNPSKPTPLRGAL